MSPARNHSVASVPDFAVLGGGLSGRLVAWRLAGEGHRVALYERGGPEGGEAAAWVAAAMLAPLAEAAVAELLITELGVASLESWPRILAELPEPVFFQRNGTLVVWHTADRTEAPLFERRVRANAPRSLADANFVALAGAQLDAAEPALAGRFARGWLLEGEGQLDNRQALAALAAGLAARGVDAHWHTTVDEANLPPARVTIDCRGLGAKPALPGLRGIRGEVARVHAPGITLTRPVRLLHPRYPLYIAPKEHDVFVIGATEIEGEDRSPVSVRSALELLSAAFAVHPAFGEARILELNTQCRPTLPDHRPALIWDGKTTLRVNGLYRHGFMIAPEVADEAARFAQALLDARVSDADSFESLRRASRWGAMLHVQGAHEPA
ncbi:FAD-dependent oxidoreductase [Paraburkholderia silvatlantica]|uniref:Glycine oxidase n=1 Tax=Paraburkholderia silvatlantica TaxID=321895 RepID=A0A2U0ZPS5_9BURK|nr:FAD-dependent oxidoreductase [Paraburkholderia silvatlantica]MBB2932106.1 glycine oxidase [Paraburkholderia silvatlantica]PVY20885.1 glycine oxidase [Paraburkholderia silvatlantica]PXW25954.1 glycine oxidase [Paraburkholderia silvatlantica]PYE17115.1 glycine oxidase [Paraburkholderia silvatlantica]